MESKPKNYKMLSNSTDILQAALDRINLFIETKKSRLDLDKTGKLVVIHETFLEKTLALACYFGRFFSKSFRDEHEKKIKLLKQAILQDRDIIQSHTFLIEKLREGDCNEKKFACYAFEAIQKYNAVVSQKNVAPNDIYQCLLEDKEIKENQIQLPSINFVKFDSHPHDYPPYKILEKLVETFRSGALLTNCKTIESSFKNSAQLMKDTFRMKAIRLIQEHLPHQFSDAETRYLVHQAPIYSQEEALDDTVHTHQKIDTGPGSFILLTGFFKKQMNASKFIIPSLTLSLSAQYSHSGFPYPSQYTGWSLPDSIVEASPLRIDQLPLFHLINQRKKQLLHQLLFESKMKVKAKHQVKVIHEALHHQSNIFLTLHHELQKKFLILNPSKETSIDFLDYFYSVIKTFSFPFNHLIQLQQQFNYLFIKQPLHALVEKWFQNHSPLRLSSSEEKFEAITFFLDQEVNLVKTQLSDFSFDSSYLFCQEALLGQPLRTIGLLYLSEKMEFIPPLLSDFEKKLQNCAFQQLIYFLNQMEGEFFSLNPEQVRRSLQTQWIKDLQLFDSSDELNLDPVLLSLTDELNRYFLDKN